MRQQALIAWTQGLQLMEDEDDEVPSFIAAMLLEKPQMPCPIFYFRPQLHHKA